MNNSALSRALARFNDFFDYNFRLPMSEKDLLACTDFCEVRGRMDLADDLRAAMSMVGENILVRGDREKFIVREHGYGVKFHNSVYPAKVYSLVADEEASEFSSEQAAAFEAGKFNLKKWNVDKL